MILPSLLTILSNVYRMRQHLPEDLEAAISGHIWSKSLNIILFSDDIFFQLKLEKKNSVTPPHWSQSNESR